MSSCHWRPYHVLAPPVQLIEEAQVLLAMEKHRLCRRMQLVQLGVAQVLASHPIFTRRHGSQLVNCRRFPGIFAGVATHETPPAPGQLTVSTLLFHDVTYYV